MTGGGPGRRLRGVRVVAQHPAAAHGGAAVPGDVGQGEDLLQEVLARVARRWKGRQRQPGGLRPGGLVNAAVDRRRRSCRRVQEYALDLSLERASGDRDPGDLLGERDEVAAAFASLPNGQWAVVVLRCFEDLSDVDTAALLGVSPGSVKSQTRRALARLRTCSRDRPTTRPR